MLVEIKAARDGAYIQHAKTIRVCVGAKMLATWTWN